MTPSTEGARKDFAIVALFHLLLAIAYVALGVRIDAQPARGCWDCFWQSVPAELLASRPIECLWYLHAQPPLFNLYGAALMRASPAHYLSLLHVAHVVLGSLCSGMVYAILRHIVRHRRAALVAALVLATNPTLLLFEAYPLYVVPTAFLATLSIFALCLRAESGRDAFLLLSVASIVSLALLWSAYHLALAILWAVLAASCAKHRGRVLVMALALTVPAMAWYARNQSLHGFFGASSWFGQGLYRAASARYSPEEVKTLCARGVLEKDLVAIPPFSLPSRYKHLGYDARSPIPLLDGDTRHNVNLIAISRAYGASARRLIVHDPAHYAANVALSYLSFTRPSPSLQAHVGANAARMPLLVLIWSQLQGAALAPLLGVPCGPFLAFVLPLLFARHAIFGFRAPDGIAAHLHRESVTTAALLLVGYTVLAGCLFEFGETARFKIAVEPLIGALVAAPIARMGARKS